MTQNADPTRKHASINTLLNAITSNDLDDCAEDSVDTNGLILGGFNPGDHIGLLNDTMAELEEFNTYSIFMAARHVEGEDSKFTVMRRLLARVAADALYAIACIDAGEPDQHLQDWIESCHRDDVDRKKQFDDRRQPRPF